MLILILDYYNVKAMIWVNVIKKQYIRFIYKDSKIIKK